MWWFIRHAEGYHNVTKRGFMIHDPVLTDTGVKQCGVLRSRLNKRPDIILCSPLRRTIMTALLVFGTDANIVLIPLLKERGRIPCNTGVDLTSLALEFPSLASQIETLDSKWWDVVNSEKNHMLSLYNTLMTYKNKSIVVVGHGTLLSEFVGMKFTNCGLAAFELERGKFKLHSTMSKITIPAEESKTST